MKEPLHSKDGEGNTALAYKKKEKERESSLKTEEKRFLRRLALRVRELRTLNGVSQEQFYKDTNIHIGRIETGKLNISINTLYRVCTYFNISIRDFFEGINKK